MFCTVPAIKTKFTNILSLKILFLRLAIDVCLTAEAVARFINPPVNKLYAHSAAVKNGVCKYAATGRKVSIRSIYEFPSFAGFTNLADALNFDL